jgi:DNA polymerase-3 subunit delta
MSKEAALLPLYLLLGPETGKKNISLQNKRDTLTRLGGQPPEEYHFYAFETPFQEAVSILRNHSLFASHKLVVYMGAEDLRKKDDLTLLAEYAKNPASDGVLVFTSDGFSVEKKLSDCVGAKGTEKFWELFDSEKKSWVASCFARRKVRISPEAIALFLELVDNSTLELQHECDSLCLFKGENSEVTAADVETYLYHSRPESVFTLFDHICACDLEMSLEILGKLLLEGESPNLVWQFRNLLAYSRLVAGSTSADEAFTRLKIRKSSQRSYIAGAKNFSPAQLENIIALCADLDEHIRGEGGGDLHTQLLELFLYGVIVRKGANVLSERF